MAKMARLTNPADLYCAECSKQFKRIQDYAKHNKQVHGYLSKRDQKKRKARKTTRVKKAPRKLRETVQVTEVPISWKRCPWCEMKLPKSVNVEV